MIASPKLLHLLIAIDHSPQQLQFKMVPMGRFPQICCFFNLFFWAMFDQDMSLGNLVIEKSWPASEAQRLKGRIAQNFSATFFDQMGSQCRSVRLTDSPHRPLQVSSLLFHPPKIVCNTKTSSLYISKRSSQFDNGVEMFFALQLVHWINLKWIS